MKQYISVDIGGTNIRSGCYSPDSIIPNRLYRTTTQIASSTPIEQVITAISSVWPKDGSIKAIGVGAPGLVDPYTGHILDTPNLAGWQDFPLGPKLSDYFHIPVFIENDANLAALGEWKFGAGKGHKDILFLTVSTGIGGGIISHGNLIQGHRGLAGEVGHMVIIPNGPMCSCGQLGHLEAISSGPSIVKYVLDELNSGTVSTLSNRAGITAREIADAARKGDSLALFAYNRAGEYLGIAGANLLHIFDPSVVIFGGGVSLAGDLLFKPFEASLKKHLFHPRYFDELVITSAALGDEAGLLGALVLAKINTER